MRRFLYISPLFPPVGRVGALRPLKFARHLPSHGWAPVVLADLPRGDRQVPQLNRLVPETVVVERNYTGREPAPLLELGEAPPPPPPPRPPNWWIRNRPRIFATHENIPIEKELPCLPHALRTARRLVRDHPDIEAIMVNANPFGAMLVGARLAAETGLPLVHDLRDPWSVCELQDARRTAWARWACRRMERYAFRRAARIILNTENARDDYRAAYPDLPPERFVTIRNHHDRDLLELESGPSHPPRQHFELLFFGGFRRFLEGETAFALLAALKARGLGDRVRLGVTGDIPESSWRLAERTGVEDMLQSRPFVPLTQAAQALEAPDVLLALGQRSRQRIVAKLYDYATTRRPVLVLSDNPEIAQLCREHAMACFGHDASEAAADWIAARMAEGRPAEVQRDAQSLSSATASAELATVLDTVTATRAGS